MDYDLPNLTKTEAKALKVMEIYLELCNKYDPDPLKVKKVKKDPRKTFLFKHCYKLVTERDLVPNQYYPFILAQFHIIRANKFIPVKDQKIIDLIGIESCERTGIVNAATLPTDKAWNRWLVWQKYFQKHEKSLEIKSSEEVGIDVHKNVIKKLEDSKKYLLDKNIDLGNKEKILHAVCLGYITGYFLFHPKLDFLNEDLLNKYLIDIKFFEKGITEEVKKWFKEN